MKAVTSRENAAFKALAKLINNAGERRKTGRSVLDGPHLLAALLDAGHKPEELMVSEAGLAKREIAKLVERAAPARVTLLSDALFAALSTVETPTGVLAKIETPASKPAPPTARLALLLYEIQDPGNVGTLLRSAAAAGADHVLLSPHCAFAWAPKVVRAGMGAHFAVNIVEGVALDDWLAAYRGTSIALAGSGESSLYELDLKKPVAILVGSEGVGLSSALLKAATARARIPMSERVESLNAAAAGTVALFEASRQRLVR